VGADTAARMGIPTRAALRTKSRGTRDVRKRIEDPRSTPARRAAPRAFSSAHVRLMSSAANFGPPAGRTTAR
jgi:hypothetical protein